MQLTAPLLTLASLLFTSASADGIYLDGYPNGICDTSVIWSIEVKDFSCYPVSAKLANMTKSIALYGLTGGKIKVFQDSKCANLKGYFDPVTAPTCYTGFGVAQSYQYSF